LWVFWFLDILCFEYFLAVLDSLWFLVCFVGFAVLGNFSLF